MNKAVPILSVLLVVQIALAFGIRYADNVKSTATTERLIKTDFSKVDKIVIEQKKNKLVIEKSKETWTLPDKFNFPAEKENVTRLLDKFKSFSRGWPVATTEDAAPRFRVSDNNCEEKVAMSAGGQNVFTVLIGSSAGFNKVHMRLDKQNEIHAVEIPEREISTNVDDWIDRGVAEIDSAEVFSVALPQLTLSRKGKDFELSFNGKIATIDALTAGEVFENASGVNISDVLGKEEKPEYGLATPAYSYTVSLKNGNKLEYKFGKLAGTNFFVLRQPNGEFYLKVDSWFVQRTKEILPEAMLAKAEQLRKLREQADKVLLEKTDKVSALKFDARTISR